MEASFCCNIKDLSIRSQFYKDLLEWWSEFREIFAEEKDWRFIIWNNKEIRLDNKTVFSENYVRSGILCANDLHLDVDNITSFNTIARNIDKNTFLLWTGLRHSVPYSLRHTLKLWLYPRLNKHLLRILKLLIRCDKEEIKRLLFSSSKRQGPIP